MKKIVLILSIFVAGVLTGIIGYATYGTQDTIVEDIPLVKDKTENDTVCIQVITPARNSQTGDIREFPTPCDVPEGWDIIQNDIPGFDTNLDLI